MGKTAKPRNRTKKNNHVPAEDVIAAEEAHGKEHSAAKRKP